MENEKTKLLDLSLGELEQFFSEKGQPKFRAKQLYRQVYVKHAGSFDEMTDLPAGLREKLSLDATLESLKPVQVFEGDEGLTRKALFQFPDGVVVETVLMVYPDRATVCVSSQAGCPMGCTFCATAKLGHLYDLTPGQMVQQVLWASRTLEEMRDGFDPKKVSRHRVKRENYPKSLTNVVFMGMGEPFNNYDNWWAAVERLHDPDGYNMGARSFTVSTVGLVPGIDRLAESGLQVNLAISLHTANDERRSKMMPVNRRYPIASLMASIRNYIEKTHRRVTFEYILLQEETDSIEEAEALVRLLTEPNKVLCHVNLIPWNPVPGTGLARSQRDRVDAFKAVLDQAGIACTIRIHRGIDIDAACGQLAGSYQKHKGTSIPVK